jgi:hypothetical protein
VVEIDPDVAQLLELKPEGKTVPVFVTRLEGLGKKKGWQQQFAECKKLSFFDWDEARAVLIRAGQIPYVVVLLKSWTYSIPGGDVQTVILMDHRGKFLDQLACEINSRLSRMHSGQFHTVIPTKPEPDGAQLVIRLDKKSARGNFAHYISHGDTREQFYWGHEDLPRDQPTKWDTMGLCRIAIKDRKFKVVFPVERDKVKPRW